MFSLKQKLNGAYAIAAIDQHDSEKFYLIRNKSPLLIGVSCDAHYAVSDPLAISDLTDNFIFLEDGDVAEASSQSLTIFDENQKKVEREIMQLNLCNNHNEGHLPN